MEMSLDVMGKGRWRRDLSTFRFSHELKKKFFFFFLLDPRCLF